MTKKEKDFHLSRSFSYCQVFVGICGIIQYSIYNNFSVFKENLKQKTFKECIPFHHAIQGD